MFETPWIRVREEEVTRPDGKPGIYGRVEFLNRAVGVVALDAEGRVALVGQHRYPLDYYSWELPEGGCPKDEEPRDAARRELREETGASAARWDYLGPLALSNSVGDEVAHLFLARELEQGEPDPEPTEVLARRWIAFETACDDALEGRLSDAITVAGLLRARHFLVRERSGLPPPVFSTSP